MEVNEKKNFDRILIIVLLAAILLLVIGIGFLLLNSERDVPMPNFSVIFKANGEYTLPLDEFVVNLKSDQTKYNYAKVSIALMFTDEKQSTTLESNVSKIRDLVITNLRSKTADDLLHDETISKLKLSIKDDINESLNLMVIQDIYITDIIVQ